MKNGYVKVCACTPKLKVADVDFNKSEIIILGGSTYQTYTK